MAVHMSVCECVCVGVSLHWDFVTATDKSSPHSTSEQGHVVWGMDVSSDRENTDRKRSKKKKEKQRWDDNRTDFFCYLYSKNIHSVMI